MHRIALNHTAGGCRPSLCYRSIVRQQVIVVFVTNDASPSLDSMTNGDPSAARQMTQCKIAGSSETSSRDALVCIYTYQRCWLLVCGQKLCIGQWPIN